MQAQHKLDKTNKRGHRLVIFIPALNEAKSIVEVIERVPKDLDGVDEIEILVINDGSTDQTAFLAQEAGAVVISHKKNLGVGAAFRTGVDYALKSGADYVVNIDADGQFNPADIHKLLEPLIHAQADMVTASRFMKAPPEMELAKKLGNYAVARIVSFLSGRRIWDASCGFRAYNRDTLTHMNLFGDFTYTQETLLDLSFKRFRILEIPIQVGPRVHGTSRVASSLIRYAVLSSKIMFRSFCDHRPFLVFGGMSLVLIVISLFLAGFVLSHYAVTGSFSPYKVIAFASSFSFALGILALMTGLVADMLSRVRKLQEKTLIQLRSLTDYSASSGPNCIHCGQSKPRDQSTTKHATE